MNLCQLILFICGALVFTVTMFILVGRWNYCRRERLMILAESIEPKYKSGDRVRLRTTLNGASVDEDVTIKSSYVGQWYEREYEVILDSGEVLMDVFTEELSPYLKNRKTKKK